MITDTAFDALMSIYERDRTLWAAVYAIDRRGGHRALRRLAIRHHIDPDA